MKRFTRPPAVKFKHNFFSSFNTKPYLSFRLSCTLTSADLIWSRTLDYPIDTALLDICPHPLMAAESACKDVCRTRAS